MEKLIFLLIFVCVSCKNPVGDKESNILGGELGVGLDKLEMVSAISVVEKESFEPTIIVTGVKSNEVVTIYKDRYCSQSVGYVKSLGKKASLKIKGLSPGKYSFFAQRFSPRTGLFSDCSNVFADYTHIGVEIIGVNDDLIPTNSKSFNWSCSKSRKCSFRFKVNTFEKFVFKDEEYSHVNNTFVNAGTGLHYLHIQAVDKNTGFESSVFTTKFILDNFAEVSITNASAITSLNMSSYMIAGECSENYEIVSLKVGDKGIDSVCNLNKWSVTLDVSSLTDGDVQIEADHGDSDGNRAIKAKKVIVKDSTPPVLSIETPIIINSKNATLYRLKGGCSENNQDVELRIEQLFYKTKCESLQWELSADVSSLSDGQLNISLDGKDLVGNSAVTVSKSVRKKSAIPTISSINKPVDGTYGTGSSLDFQITYSDKVIVAGVPCFDLFLDNEKVKACYKGGTGEETLTFTYQITDGTSALNGILAGSLIANGSIEDSYGNNANLNIQSKMPSLVNVLIDTSVSPPLKITNLNQTNLTSDRMSASFNWSIPADNGTPIRKYLVRYRLIGTNKFTYVNPEPTNNQVTILGLDRDQDYEVQIAAFTSVAGPFSDSLSFSTKFNPASLGALIWYEAKDIDNSGVPLVDGTSINTFIDKSGNNNNAVKLSGAPATIETVNGHKVIRLGKSGYRTTQTLGENPNVNIEVFIVAKTRAISHSFAFVNENQANNRRFGAHFPWGNGIAYIDLPMGNRIYGAWGGNVNDIFAWSFRSSTTSGRYLERDGIEVLKAGNRKITPPLKKWTIGSNFAGTGTFWQADLLAIFVFDKQLSSQQRNDFYDYIELNYGVTMN